MLILNCVWRLNTADRKNNLCSYSNSKNVVAKRKYGKFLKFKSLLSREICDQFLHLGWPDCVTEYRFKITLLPKVTLIGPDFTFVYDQ